MSGSIGLLLLGNRAVTEMAGAAVEAERDGFGSVWVADERFFRDCWATLAHLASRTHSIGLGVCVTDPFVRHPALTATAMATVDEISGGRGILGLGVGVSGFSAMGISRDRPLAAMRDAIGVIRALWAGEVVDHDGQSVKAHRLRLDFPARADIPILVASNGPQMLRLAGVLADAVMVQGMATGTMVDNVRRLLEDGAESRTITQPPRLIARLDVCISEDPDAARQKMVPSLVRHLVTHYPRYASFELAGLEVSPDLNEAIGVIASRSGYGHGSHPKVENLIPVEWVDRFSLVGTADDVVSAIRRLRSAGVDEVTVMFVDPAGAPPGSTRAAFVSEVLPRVEGEGATS